MCPRCSINFLYTTMVLLSCHQWIWKGAKCNKISTLYFCFSIVIPQEVRKRNLWKYSARQQLAKKAVCRRVALWRSRIGGLAGLVEMRDCDRSWHVSRWWWSCHVIIAGWLMANSLPRMFQGYWQSFGVRVEQEQGVKKTWGQLQCSSNSKRISVMAQESDISKTFEPIQLRLGAAKLSASAARQVVYVSLSGDVLKKGGRPWMPWPGSRVPLTCHGVFGHGLGHSELPLQIRNTSRHWHGTMA